MHFLSSPLLLLSFGLFAIVSTGSSQSQAPVDSIALVREDSIRSHQKEVQALLQQEFHEMTRFPLGSEVDSWSHSLDMEVTRGGRTHVQRFWFNPKQNGSMIWLPDSSRSNECLYYDPITDRLASLFPQSLTGTLISPDMATKMGLKGNATITSPKRKSNWKSQPSDSLQRVRLDDNTTSIEVGLGERSVWQADGVNAWLSMQPVPGYSLPPKASKQPICFFEQTTADEIVLYRFRLLEIIQLEEPFELDLSVIRVDDPTRSLNVIAKEWAEKNKAKTLED